MKFSLARFPVFSFSGFLVFPFSRLLVVLVAVASLLPQAYAQVVNFPDPNLEGAITEALELPANTLITQQDMLQLMILDIRDSSIADLTGLEYAVNIEALYSMNNQITDISPLANLTNLTYLYLGDNALKTIEPLAGLINLRVLDLYNTGVKDITPLANLTALESLVIIRNMIVDLSPLRGLKDLKRLQLAENPIRDFSPLTELEGLELDLDIDLSRLDQLHLVVEVPDSNLRQAIREARSLPGGVPLTQLEMLQLTELSAWALDITDLTGLQYATNLVYLHLWGNQIRDLTPLANLTKLRDLDLADNAVESIKPVSRLINLQRLSLTFNRIQDITPLATLINLEKLYLRENLVTDITTVQRLNLIEFEYDEICDFPPIAPPVRERMENRNFPSIFAWGGSHSTVGLDHLTPDQRAALHDLDFGVWLPSIHWDQTPTEPAEGLATSLAANLSRARTTLQKRLDLNPNHITLLSVDYRDHYNDEPFPPDSDFWLRDENGEIVRKDSGSPQINFLKPEVQDLIVKRIVAVERCGLYDGVMLDQFIDHGVFGLHHQFATEEEIIQAILNIFRAVREQTRDDFLIMINANRTKSTRYAEYVNGSFMESGQAFTHNDFQEIESTLSWNEQHFRSPTINCLQGEGIPHEPPDSPNNRRWMRVWTTLSLTHSDGYVMYDTGWGTVAVCPECPYVWGAAHEHIWYDFWDVDLGRPVGSKAQHHQNIDGLFIREFTNGWAVYNRSGTPQTITLPTSATPASDRGNNAASMTHLLPDLDGEIYLKAKNPADVNGDGVVNVLDLVHVANNFGKADPDLNGDGVVNILDLTLVAKHLSQNAAAPSQLALIESIPSTAKEIIAVQHALTELEAIPNKSHGVQIVIELLRHYLSIAAPNVQETKLLSNYPNPFNPDTWIPYQLSEESTVTVKIYDVTGNLVRTIQVGHKPAGYYRTREQAIYWDGRNQNREPVSSGVYFYTFNTNTYTQTRRMVILK